MVSGRKGFTLIEVIVSFMIFAVVATAAGSVIYSAAQSYALNTQMRDDEYNARVALLSITREAHRGMNYVETAPSQLTLAIINEYNELEFEVVYALGTDNILRRTIIQGETPVAFVESELQEFVVNFKENRWLNIKIVGKYGLELETTISLLRVPENDTGGEDVE